VALLMELRRAYLAAGGSPLKHWDQITDRLRAAARTSATVPEWTTALMRSLQLGAPSRSLSSAIDALAVAVTEVGAAAWLDLLEREHGYVMARARLEAERRRESTRQVEDNIDAAVAAIKENAR
jgi:hypothetical protein